MSGPRDVQEDAARRYLELNRRTPIRDVACGCLVAILVVGLLFIGGLTVLSWR